MVELPGAHSVPSSRMAPLQGALPLPLCVVLAVPRRPEGQGLKPHPPPPRPSPRRAGFPAERVETLSPRGLEPPSRGDQGRGLGNLKVKEGAWGTKSSTLICQKPLDSTKNVTALAPRAPGRLPSSLTASVGWQMAGEADLPTEGLCEAEWDLGASLTLQAVARGWGRGC